MRKYRENGNFKNNRMGWLLLGTPENLKEDQEMLRVTNHLFKAKYENHRASLGDENVKLRFRTKSSRASKKV